jgi:hypothetical protein
MLHMWSGHKSRAYLVENHASTFTMFYTIRWLSEETNGLGGICRFCNLPVNMFTTFVIDGRFLGFHWMHQRATMASCFTVFSLLLLFAS